MQIVIKKFKFLGNNLQSVPVVAIPVGNFAKDLPQAFFTVVSSSEKTRPLLETAPQKKGTLPSES